MCGKNTDLMCVIIFLFLIRPLVTPGIDTINEGVQKVFGTLDLFVSLLETEIKYPILQGGILPFWTPSCFIHPYFYNSSEILKSLFANSSAKPDTCFKRNSSSLSIPIFFNIH